MKKLIISVFMLMTLGLVACEEETTKYIENDVDPAVPQGVYSITGDEQVTVIWMPVQDDDLSYYEVWRSDDDYTYNYLDDSYDTTYVDTDLTNGETIYYAVRSVDEGGNVSALSFNYFVFDTPRSQGVNVRMHDNFTDSARAAFDFSTHTVVPYMNAGADIFLTYENVFKSPDDTTHVFFLNVANIYTDIQDMGYTYDFDEISYVPDTMINDTAAGWSEIGWVEVAIGHTYVFWTADNHFAKIRITSVDEPSDISFDWAYQDDVGNLELARPQHNEEEYLRRTLNMTILR